MSTTTDRAESTATASLPAHEIVRVSVPKR